MFSFSSTCRGRLRLPSVSPQSCLRSPKVNPLVSVIRDVSTLRRARSWITRSSPSYANRASLDLDFICARMRAEQQKSCHQQLSCPIGNAHSPGGEGAVAAQRNAEQASHQVPGSCGEQWPGQKTAGRKNAQAENDLPYSRDHPQGCRNVAHEHDGKQQACSNRG